MFFLIFLLRPRAQFLWASLFIYVINLHWRTLYEGNYWSLRLCTATYMADNAYFRYTSLTSCRIYYNEMPQNDVHSCAKLLTSPKYDFTLKRLTSPNISDK